VSLTAARGPLGTDPSGTLSPPAMGPFVYIEPHPRRVTALRDGATVVDTEDVLLVHRPGAALAYAFRPQDVGDLPAAPVPERPDRVQVPWDVVDEWFEEGRRLVHYPPNPYHRVDCRPTRRRLKVTVDGTTLVDTDDTTILFETSLAPKLYVRRDLVRMDLLRPSETTTYCNYKGWTTYWDAVLAGTVVRDVAWTYDDPLPESTAIAGMVSFEPAHVDLEADLPAAG
jgi:uncharacterized protein (DUF427 family)